MKRTLILAAMLALPVFAIGEEKPLKERATDAVETIKRDTKVAADATVKAAREAWKSTKAALSPDPNEYREGATRKLDNLAAEIAALKKDPRKDSVAGRNYFQTRVKALHEHLEYARAELAKLPADKDQKDYAQARKHLDHTLQSLEKAADQARDEVTEES